METIAVYANDAAYARHLLEPMLHGAQTRWVVVACPPTLTRHAGRWLSQSARQQWRERWAVRSCVDGWSKPSVGKIFQSLCWKTALPFLAAY